MKTCTSCPTCPTPARKYSFRLPILTEQRYITAQQEGRQNTLKYRLPLTGWQKGFTCSGQDPENIISLQNSLSCNDGSCLPLAASHRLFLSCNINRSVPAAFHARRTCNQLQHQLDQLHGLQ